MVNQDESKNRNFYDSFANQYHQSRIKDNQHLDLRSVLEVLGNLKKKKLLDYGCGTGIQARIFSERGAIVSGFDISKRMLEIARKNNPALDLREGSGYKIPFNEKFDIVFAGLVLSHMKYWDSVFAEVSRVLKNNGTFVFTTYNPVSEVSESIKLNGKRYKILGTRDYFDNIVTHSGWVGKEKGTSDAKLPSYHRTYQDIIRTIIANGFEIVDYKDVAYSLKTAKTLFPDQYERLSKMPIICIWRVKKK